VYLKVKIEGHGALASLNTTAIA